MFVDKLECPSTDGLMLRIGGPQPDESRNSLLFTPAFPCGVERSIAFTAATDVPLVRVATMKVCLGDACDPTRNVLVRGHVQSVNSQRGPGLIQPLDIDVCQGASSQIRVKLEIWSCKWVGPVIIDSDSEIVVPAGEASINVLAPGPSVGQPGWVRGQTTLAGVQQWTDVTLRIAACPVDTYVPPGVLSEYIVGLTDASPVGSGFLIRPRRARRLEMSNRDGLGAPATVTIDALGDFGTAMPALGSNLFPTTPLTMDLPGAMQAISLRGVPAGVNTYVRWEIR